MAPTAASSSRRPRRRRRRPRARNTAARRADPGRGRAGHLVQLRAVAVLDAGLAGADQGARPVLSWRCAGDRLRHHLLLGRADDDAGHPLHGRGAVPRCLHPWPGARRARPEDVEVEGQQHRSAGADRSLRRRCAALHHLRADRTRARREAGRGTRRELSALRHQAVERGAVLRDERHPAGCIVRSVACHAAADALDPRCDEPRDRGGERGARSVSFR